MNLPWKRTPEDAAATVARLKERRSELLGELERAKNACGVAGLEADEKNTKEAITTHNKARETLERLRVGLTELDLKLPAAEARHVEAIQNEQKSDLAKRWKKVEELAQARMELAADLTKDAEAFVEKLKRLSEISIETYHAAPLRNCSLPGSSLAVEFIEYATRLQLFKFGCMWAARWPNGVEAAPTLTKSVKDGNEWVLSYRQPETRDADEKASAETTN